MISEEFVSLCDRRLRLGQNSIVLACARDHCTDLDRLAWIAILQIEPQIGGHEGSEFELFGHHETATKFPSCRSLGPLLGRYLEHPTAMHVLGTFSDQATEGLEPSHPTACHRQDRFVDRRAEQTFPD